MATLKKIERIIAQEENPVQSPPFPVPLTPGSTVDLCTLTVPLKHAHSAFTATALVNWSVTFTPTEPPQNINLPGFAQVSFELLRDGHPLLQVTRSAYQPVFSSEQPLFTAVTTFKTAHMQHLDISELAGPHRAETTYLLRAKNIILVPPVRILGTIILPAATVTAAAGLTSLLLADVRTARAPSLHT